jgi:ribosomal protein L18
MKNLNKKIFFYFIIKKTVKNIYCKVFNINNKSIIIEFCSLSKQIIRSINLFNIKNKIIISKMLGFIIRKKIINMNINNILFKNRKLRFCGRIEALAFIILNNKYK